MIIAIYLYDQSVKKGIEVQRRQLETDKFVADNSPKFDALAGDIFKELSAKHSTKPLATPAVATSTTRSDPSPSVSIQREIERETVKIRCPYCRTLNPDARSFCSHCGARL